MFGKEWPRIFIGYDEAQRGSWHCLTHSIMEKSSLPVQFIPLYYKTVPGYGREVKEGYTQFSYLRYYIPSMCNFEGWALYQDSDQFWRSDIAELWKLRDDKYDLMCHKSGMNQKTIRGDHMKMYAKANYHSVSLWNCEKLKHLTPTFINKASREYLRDMNWTTDEKTGVFGAEFNHLVDVYNPNDNAKVIHFTIGGPWHPGFAKAPYSDEWRALHNRMSTAEKQ